ncbi:MAG: hypothetical protein ACLFVR_07725 [Thiohalospira sp.]
MRSLLFILLGIFALSFDSSCENPTPSDQEIIQQTILTGIIMPMIHLIK